MSDISDTLAPKSDQLDNIELADGPRDFTVTRVDVNPGAEQPVNVYFAEFPRPWRPGVTMRRVLGHYWSNDSSTWIGRRIRLFRDPNVPFGKDKPGGTRISHMSDMGTTTPAPVLLSRGQMGTYKVDPLPDAPTPPTDSAIACSTDTEQLKAWWREFPTQRAAIEARVEEIKVAEQPTDAQ